MRQLLFAAILASSAACASTGNYGGAISYIAPTLTLPQLRADLGAAIELFARDEGWTVVARDADRIEAVSAADDSMGVTMRERWVFAIEDYRISAIRTLEAQWDKGGDWEHDAQVCTGYVYLREHEVLSQLEKQAARGASLAVANRSAAVGAAR